MPISENKTSCLFCGTNLCSYYEKERKNMIIFIWATLFVAAVAVGQFCLGAWLWAKGMKVLGGIVYAMCAMSGLGAICNLVSVCIELPKVNREIAALRYPTRR